MTACSSVPDELGAAGRDRPSVDHFRMRLGVALDFEIVRSTLAKRLKNGLRRIHVGRTPSASRSPSCEPVSGGNGPSVKAVRVPILPCMATMGAPPVLHGDLGLRGVALREESLGSGNEGPADGRADDAVVDRGRPAPPVLPRQCRQRARHSILRQPRLAQLHSGRPSLADTGMSAFERLEPQRGHSCRHSVTAVLDPLETFMTAAPGEPLRRKADDKVPCGRAVTIYA
jgi:hypothetical protein